LLFGSASLLVWFKELYLANPDMARDKNRLYRRWRLSSIKIVSGDLRRCCDSSLSHSLSDTDTNRGFFQRKSVPSRAEMLAIENRVKAQSQIPTHSLNLPPSLRAKSSAMGSRASNTRSPLLSPLRLQRLLFALPKLSESFAEVQEAYSLIATSFLSLREQSGSCGGSVEGPVCL
jgi:hypothetical protein